MSEGHPLVSIIVPIYNAELYLRQCLDSIIAQSYKHLEIICINDGSTDKSAEIAKEYAKNDSRICYIQQENKGGGAARNVGLEVAKGEFVLCFDADDYMSKNAIESLVARAKESRAEIVIAKSRELRDNEVFPMTWALRLDMLPAKVSFNYKDLGDNVFGFCVGWAWDKLYKRSFIESFGLRFEDVKSPSDDLYFTFMSLVLARSISVCDKVLFTHRKHSASQESMRDVNPCLFLNSLRLWQSALVQKGVFKEVEKSYLNWTLHFCLWHLNTLSDKAHYRLFYALKGALYELGIAKAKRADFYNQRHYAQMRYILFTPLWLHRFNALRICNIKGIFRIRLSTKGGIIRLFGKTLYKKNYNECF